MKIRVTWEGRAKQTARFRARPLTGQRWFYDVVIFPNKAEMRRYHQHYRGTFGPLGRASGCCHSSKTLKVPVAAKPYLTPKLGEIHFFRHGLTMRIITHECVHAGIGCMNRLKVSLASLDSDFTRTTSVTKALPRDCPEERLCHAIDELAVHVVIVAGRNGWI